MMKRLRSLISELKADISVTSNIEWTEISVTAPDKKLWIATETHFLVSSGRSGKGALDILAADLIKDVELGLIDCEVEDCEVCAE